MLAAELGLGVAAKPDSQDICFVPDGDYAGLVKKLRPEADIGGDIVDEHGRSLGRHRGLIHFTVGQRRGLEIGVHAGAALCRPALSPRAAASWSGQRRRLRVGSRTAFRDQLDRRGP